MTATPALDFLRKVEVWQQAPGGTAGLAVPMPDGDEHTLGTLLSEFRGGARSTGWLETQARSWLVGYREMNPPLTAAQRTELDDVIARTEPDPRPAHRPHEHRARLPRRTGWLIGIALALLVVISGAMVIRGMHSASPVPPGNAAPANPAQQIPAGQTGLTQFVSDWGPFTQLPASVQDPQTGAPALLLLENGKYLVSGWQLPARDKGWAPDMSGSITAVTVHGSWAAITDADGNTWAVTIRQPFVLATLPAVVLTITATGDVLSMPEDHAVVVRTHTAH